MAHIPIHVAPAPRPHTSGDMNKNQNTQTRFQSRLRTKVASLAAAAVLLPTTLAGVTPAMAAPAATSGIEFTDNPVGSSYYDVVAWMGEQGLSEGYTDGSFGKTRHVTRGETAAFLYRLVDPAFNAPDKSKFQDLKAGETHYEAITWLSSEGHIGGYVDGSFRKNRTITRGEAAKMLFNANEVDYQAPTTSAFPDVKVGSEYHRYLSWFNETGLSTGYTDGEYKPSRNITRAELAKLLKGTHDEVAEPVEPTPSEEPTTPAPEPTPTETPEPTDPVVEPTPEPTPSEDPTTPAPEPTPTEAPEPTDPVVEPTPTEEPEPSEPVVEPTPEPEPPVTIPATPLEPARPSWDKAPTEMAVVPQDLDYQSKAEYLLGYYGCTDITPLIVDHFSGGENVTGSTVRPKGAPAAVHLRSGLSDTTLNGAAAHECMHVKQHEVSGMDRGAFDAMIADWYPEGLTYETKVDGSWVTKDLPVAEQSAECAIREMGFTKYQSAYMVDCDKRGLLAGRAIANGLDPNVVIGG